jgi:hypothetical protein
MPETSHYFRGITFLQFECRSHWGTSLSAVRQFIQFKFSGAVDCARERKAISHPNLEGQIFVSELSDQLDSLMISDRLRAKLLRQRRALRQLNKAHATLWKVVNIQTTGFMAINQNARVQAMLAVCEAAQRVISQSWWAPVMPEQADLEQKVRAWESAK